MTSKDWILLIVPIFANGFVLYLLQLYFQSKLKRIEHKNEVKEKINNCFFSLLLDVKANFRTLGRCIHANPEDTELISKNLANYNKSIGKALEYYNDYDFFLKDYSSIIKELNSTFDKYLEVGSRLACAPLDDQGRGLLTSYINKLYQLVCNVANSYMKEL